MAKKNPCALCGSTKDIWIVAPIRICKACVKKGGTK